MIIPLLLTIHQCFRSGSFGIISSVKRNHSDFLITVIIKNGCQYRMLFHLRILLKLLNLIDCHLMWFFRQRILSLFKPLQDIQHTKTIMTGTMIWLLFTSHSRTNLSKIALTILDALFLCNCHRINLICEHVVA